jgi:Autophagy protein Atg8 ubiquitin like
VPLRCLRTLTRRPSSPARAAAAAHAAHGCRSALMSQIYADKADEDMFLYVKYSSEGTFG